MLPVYLVDESGTRRVRPDEFPLALPRSPGAQTSAHIGSADGELFVQPASSDLPILCNSTLLKTSRWLRDGDVVRIGKMQVSVEFGEEQIRLRVEKWKTAQKTDPPVLPPTEHPPSGMPGTSDISGAAVKPIAFEPVRVGPTHRERPPIRTREVVLWTSLALLAAAAYFVFTARSVLVETEPGEAQIDFQNTYFKLELGGRYMLRQGKHTVVIEKEGYRPVETEVTVTDERNQRLLFVLTKRPGVLVLSTVPSEGAVVTIDGEEIGVTPVAELELPPGEHEVLIRAENHKDFLTRVHIEGAGSTETLDAVLEPRWGAISFTSQPPGATVEVNGLGIGSTPLTADLMEGAHTFTLMLKGHKPYRSGLAVVAGEAQTLPTARLTVADGLLTVESNPPGATVTVDGVYSGETPLTVDLQPRVGHQVEVSRAGYETQTQEARIESGSEQTLSIELAPLLGKLEVVSDPPDAVLYVNGEERGSANQTLSLVALPQQIEVRKEGYEAFTTTLTPRPGFPQSIEVTLRTLEEAKAALTPAVITTSEGHQLRLIQPARFRMGASRREPGRRANETLREVELSRRYYLAVQEVTNQQFRKLDPKHRSGRVAGLNLDIDHHPVVRVTWSAAARYCNWLSQKESWPPAYDSRGGSLVAVVPPTMGYRLPTEAEWVRVARYPDGQAGRKYPWGDSLPVAANSGNYADASARGLVPTTLPQYDDSYPATAPAEGFPPNPLGILNLGGNVAEWMHDYYTIYPSGAEIAKDPLGPKEGELYAIRGSSWMDGSVTELRLSYRDYGNKPRPDLGFRIARYAE